MLTDERIDALQAKVAELETQLKYSGMAATAEARRGDELQTKIVEQSVEIERLTQESACYAANLRGKHATTGATYQHMQATIAQQVELIEKCKEALNEHHSLVAKREALAAIAAHKKEQHD